MTKPNIQAARDMGVRAFKARAFKARAFKAGAPRVPALCGQLGLMFAGRAMGDPRTNKELLAWISGWTQASLED